MEELAAAAGVSKATIYAYFRDKDAAFHAVAKRLARRIGDAAGTALAGAGPLPERIAQALVAKHTIVFEVVRSSPFAEELFAARNRTIAALFETLDGEIKAMLARAMVDAGVGRAAAESTARLLFGAAQGIANHDRDVPTMQADIATLVDGIIGS